MPGDTKSAPSSIGTAFLGLMSNFWGAATAFTEAIYPQLSDDFWDDAEPVEPPKTEAPKDTKPTVTGVTTTPVQDPPPRTTSDPTPPPKTTTPPEQTPKPKVDPEPPPPELQPTVTVTPDPTPPTQDPPTPITVTTESTPPPTPSGPRTLRQVTDEAKTLKFHFGFLLYATRDAAFSTALQDYDKAVKAKDAVKADEHLTTCKGLVPELETRVKGRASGIDRKYNNVDIAFRQQRKRIGEKQGKDLQLEFLDNKAIVAGTLLVIKQGALTKDEPSLTELEETVAAMEQTVEQMKSLPDAKDAPVEVEEVEEKLPGSLSSMEYPFGAANKVPHIHNYGGGFHLKYFDGSRVTRINLVQDGKRYEDRITEALDYADTYTATATQKKLGRVLRKLLE